MAREAVWRSYFSVFYSYSLRHLQLFSCFLLFPCGTVSLQNVVRTLPVWAGPATVFGFCYTDSSFYNSFPFNLTEIRIKYGASDNLLWTDAMITIRFVFCWLTQFLNGEYYLGVLCYVYLFISRRQHAEWIFTRFWNKWNDFSSVVFLMNTNFFRFVMISLSSLFMRPGLSCYNFTELMKGMYCSLLKELPLWVVFPLACRSYQDRFCRGEFITVWISLAFSQAISTTFTVWKGNRTLL